MKRCSVCQEEKPDDQFYQFASGASKQCKPCRRLKVRASQIRMVDRAGGPTLPPPGTTKRCSACRAEKPIEQFGHNKSRPDGLQMACRACSVAAVTASRHKDPTSHRRSSRAWSAKQPAGEKADSNLRWKLGLEPGTYARMLVEQDGKCAMCGSDKPGTRITRFRCCTCRRAGRARGLSRGKCNIGIGQLNHDPKLLQAGIDYLTRTPR